MMNYDITQKREEEINNNSKLSTGSKVPRATCSSGERAIE